MAAELNREDVSSLVERISIAGAAFASHEANAREQLLSLAYRLATSLELPSETVMRMGWAEPARTAHCKVAVDLKLFDLLKQSSPQGMTAAELAKASEADPMLIARLMKHLVAMNIVDETPAGQYTATRLSNGFTEPRYRDGVSYVCNVPGPSLQALPAYLEKTAYRNPTDLADGPFQFAHGTKLPFFGWLAENPTKFTVFNNYMGGYRAGRPSWVDPGFYPVSKRLTSAFDAQNSPVMLVDVGGGLGHDLVELKAKHPDLPGDLILQDQDNVITQIKAPDGSALPFTAMVHDFFTPQPVQHARAYHLHSVLHDWDDETCVKILANIIPAMKHGYSSVLLFEMAVPDRGAPWPVTSMDWLMAALGGMHERTLAEWESILHRAGLKISKVWTVEMGSESLIEAELV